MSLLSTSIPHCLITIITFKWLFRSYSSDPRYSQTPIRISISTHPHLHCFYDGLSYHFSPTSVSRRLRRCLCTSTRNLRRTLILFGGAAGITHGILDRKNNDVEILVGVEVLAILYDMIDNRWGEGLLQALRPSH